jgi:hypothetical protein
MFRCTTCDQAFDIPDDAVLLSKGTFSRIKVYRFPDGAVHSFRLVKPMSALGRHNRWHKTARQSGCELCFPLIVS